MKGYTTNMQLSTMVTKRSVTVNFDGQTHSLPATDPSYQKMVDAIRAKDHEAIRALVSRAKMAVAVGNATSDANFEVRHGVVLIDGRETSAELSAQIVEFMNEGLPFQPLVNFYRKLRKNPSFRAVQALFSFLEKNRHPITDSGNFIAYKRVQAADSEGRMLDIHSGTFDNRPGSVLEMPRNEVDEDPTRTCSTGLHVANWDYAANHFGGGQGVMLEVEVDPANVVAIPIDYKESKMRVCGYTVRLVVTNPNTSNTLVVDSDEAEDESSDSEENLEESDDELEDEEDDEDEDEEDEDCEDCDEDAEEDDGSQPRPTNPVDASEAAVPMHSRETLRKMSTDRLRAYQKRLTAMSTLVPAVLRERAATLLVVLEILKSRR